MTETERASSAPKIMAAQDTVAPIVKLSFNSIV